MHLEIRKLQELWLIQRPQRHRPKQATIIGDSMTTGAVAQLLASPKRNTGLGRMLQGLFLVCQLRVSAKVGVD